jgi:hypothetical protein
MPVKPELPVLSSSLSRRSLVPVLGKGSSGRQFRGGPVPGPFPSRYPHLRAFAPCDATHRASSMRRRFQMLSRQPCSTPPPLARAKDGRWSGRIFSLRAKRSPTGFRFGLGQAPSSVEAIVSPRPQPEDNPIAGTQTWSKRTLSLWQRQKV